MAEMTIRLQIDPSTGKKNIIVSLRSDSDSLPHEHEQLHRQLVDKLIEGGAITAGEAGNLIIEREEEADVSESPSQAQKQAERQSQTESG